MRGIIAAILFLLILSGCEDGDSKEQNASEIPGLVTPEPVSTGSISGKLSPAPSNNALKGTADSFRLALDTTAKIAASDITVDDDGTFLISNIDPTNNAAITLADDNNVGIHLNQLQVQSDETTELGTITLKPTAPLDIKLISQINAQVIIEITALGFTQKISTSRPLKLGNVPEGDYLVTVRDINTKLLTTQFIKVPIEENLLTLDLDKALGNNRVFGIVKDSRGAAVNNAKVYLRTSQENISIDITDDEGHFDLSNLKNGIYSLLVIKNGYRALEEKEVTLSGGTIKELNDLILVVESKKGAIAGHAFFEHQNSHAGMDITLEKLNSTDESTNQLGTLRDGSFLINALSEGSYLLHFGKDSDSRYQRITSEPIKVTKGVTTIIEAPIVLKTIDPNAPKITNVQITSNDPSFFKESNTTYRINPDQALHLDVSAQDEDGDTINYLFVTESGSLYDIDSDNGAATWKAPKTPGSYTLTLRAKSKYQTDLQTITILVNQAPTINFISHTLAELVNLDSPLTFDYLDQAKITAEARDPEDGTIDGTQITWFSDIQGKLAQTDTLQQVLIPGLHTITLTVKDSGGLSTHSTIYVKVKSPELIWLKAPNTSAIQLYAQGNGTYLKNSMTLDLGEQNISLSTLDSNITEVDGDGLITAVNTGTTKIHLQFENGEQHDVGVRVLGEITTESNGTLSTPASLGVGDIKQVRVRAPLQITLKALSAGDYALAIFDDKDIVTDSQTRSSVKVNGATKTSPLTGNGVHYFSVPVAGDDYTLILEPNTVGNDELLKIGVFPSPNNRDDNGELLSTYVDDNYVILNNDKLFPTPITLDTTVQGAVNFKSGDPEDWYVVKNAPIGVYTVYFKTLTGTSEGYKDSTTFHVEQNGVDLLVGTSITGIGLTSFTFTVDQVGDINIKLSQYNNHKSLYEFHLYPNFENGLVQNANFEPNDFKHLATEVKLDTTVKSTLGLEPFDRDDWYVVRALPAGTYTMQWQTFEGSYIGYKPYTYMSIWQGDTDIKSAQSLNGIASNTFTFTLDTPGDIKIWLNSDQKEQYVDVIYSFHLYPDLENGLKQDQFDEPNNFSHLATPVTLDTTINNTLGLDNFDTDDWYILKNLPVGIYTVQWQTYTGTYVGYKPYTYMSIWQDDTEIRTAQTITGIDANSFTFEVLHQGDVKIFINNDQKAAKVDVIYSFHVYPDFQNGLIQNQFYEPNNYENIATPLERGTLIESTLNVSAADTDDWYQLKALPIGTYSVDIETLVGTFEGYKPYTKISLWQNGLLLQTAETLTGIAAKTFTFKLKESGDISVLIHNEANAQTIYTLKIYKPGEI